MSQETEDVIFALQPGTIRIDDIVLTSDFGAIPLGIRTFTRSDFSHAALCTKPDMLFEAVREGVMRRSVLGTYAPRQAWIRVLRPKQPLAPNQHGLRVADYAEALYGRAYSRRGAAASRFSLLGGAEDGSVFCSQVIAQAYLDYGVSLLPGMVPAQTYPGLLLDSSELIDVTDRCTRKLSPVADADLYRQVVDTAHHELPGAEMRMNRRAFGAVQKELGRDLPTHVHSLTDLALWLVQDFDSEAVKRSDAKILATLEGEGIFEWYDAFSAKVQADEAGLALAARAAELSAGERMDEATQALLGQLTETIPMGEASLAARKNTAQEYDALAKRTGLRTFARLRDTYYRQYEDARRIHKAQMRLVAALRQRKPEMPA